MKNKETKSIFSSLENFSSTPPPELWANIEAKLDQPKKKKSPVIWWWTAACLVVGLSISGLWQINSDQENNFELNFENNSNKVVLQNDSKVDTNTNENKRANTIEKISFGKKENSENKTKNKNLNANENQFFVTNSNSSTTKTTPVISLKKNDSRIFKNSNRKKNNKFIA